MRFGDCLICPGNTLLAARRCIASLQARGTTTGAAARLCRTTPAANAGPRAFPPLQQRTALAKLKCCRRQHEVLAGTSPSVGNPAGRPRLPGLIRTPKAWDILKYLLLAHHYLSSLALVAVLYADAHHSNGFVAVPSVSSSSQSQLLNKGVILYSKYTLLRSGTARWCPWLRPRLALNKW